MFLRRPYCFGNPAAMGKGFVGALDDQTTNLAYARSVSRRLLTSYNGALIKVRRSSDSLESDIYSKANGDLDTVALLAWVGGGNGYISKIYDQLGSSHLIQSTGAAQPRIVNTGTVDTLLGKPCAVATGVESMDAALAGSNAAGWTAFTVGSLAASEGSQSNGRLITFGTDPGSYDYISLGAFIGVYRSGLTVNSLINISNTASKTVSSATGYIFTSKISTSPIVSLQVNNLTATTTGTGTPNLAFATNRLFQGISSTQATEHWTGSFCESVGYRIAQATPATVRDIINAYYGAF